FAQHCGNDPKLIRLNEDLKRLIVRYHNIYRNLVADGAVNGLPSAERMLVLHWDKHLAKVAEYAVKRCNLSRPPESLSTPNARNPGFNSALHFFPIEQKRSVRQIIRTQLQMWFNQHQHMIVTDLQLDWMSKNTWNFKQMMIGLNSRVGCAVANYVINGIMNQLMICLYGCQKKQRKKIYATGKNASQKCKCGTGTEYLHLCHENERVDDCDAHWSSKKK
ncbi:hypothetical protein KR222_007825, partial [Zaprionus bogoriensis]